MTTREHIISTYKSLRLRNYSITVTSLMRAASRRRQTFYDHFDCLETLYITLYKEIRTQHATLPLKTFLLFHCVLFGHSTSFIIQCIAQVEVLSPANESLIKQLKSDPH